MTIKIKFRPYKTFIIIIATNGWSLKYNRPPIVSNHILILPPLINSTLSKANYGNAVSFIGVGCLFAFHLNGNNSHSRQTPNYYFWNTYPGRN